MLGDIIEERKKLNAPINYTSQSLPRSNGTAHQFLKINSKYGKIPNGNQLNGKLIQFAEDGFNRQRYSINNRKNFHALVPFLKNYTLYQQCEISAFFLTLQLLNKDVNISEFKRLYPNHSKLINKIITRSKLDKNDEHEIENIIRSNNLPKELSKDNFVRIIRESYVLIRKTQDLGQAVINAPANIVTNHAKKYSCGASKNKSADINLQQGHVTMVAKIDKFGVKRNSYTVGYDIKTGNHAITDERTIYLDQEKIVISHSLNNQHQISFNQLQFYQDAQFLRKISAKKKRNISEKEKDKLHEIIKNHYDNKADIEAGAEKDPLIQYNGHLSASLQIQVNKNYTTKAVPRLSTNNYLAQHLIEEGEKFDIADDPELKDSKKLHLANVFGAPLNGDNYHSVLNSESQLLTSNPNYNGNQYRTKETESSLDNYIIRTEKEKFSLMKWLKSVDWGKFFKRLLIGTLILGAIACLVFFAWPALVGAGVIAGANAIIGLFSSSAIAMTHGAALAAGYATLSTAFTIFSTAAGFISGKIQSFCSFIWPKIKNGLNCFKCCGSKDDIDNVDCKITNNPQKMFRDLKATKGEITDIDDLDKFLHESQKAKTENVKIITPISKFNAKEIKRLNQNSNDHDEIQSVSNVSIVSNENTPNSTVSYTPTTNGTSIE